jgi:putative glutamine amidotransferase
VQSFPTLRPFSVQIFHREVGLSGPLIGLTTSRQINTHNYPVLYTAEAYVQAITEAGACPVLIPLGLPEATLRDMLTGLDGVVLTGGGDVHPKYYHADENPLIDSIDEDRDRVEIQILQDAMQQSIPFLGICRGLQVINVALGGNLYADISEQRPQSLRHNCFPEKPRHHLAHTVEIRGESHLGHILKTPLIQVNSMHHQGIEILAPGLKATAYAPDGLIEAFEIPGYPFGLAVQWHPEWLREHAEMRALFQAFVSAAQTNGKA